MAGKNRGIHEFLGPSWVLGICEFLGPSWVMITLAPGNRRRGEPAPKAPGGRHASWA